MPPEDGPQPALRGDWRHVDAAVLKSVLDGARLNRLAAPGCVLDPSFGNYMRTFPADIPNAQLADRINAPQKRVFASFNAGIGYIQCMPEDPEPAMYCEAQSEESWPALSPLFEGYGFSGAAKLKIITAEG
jgi:hypothetical protein